MTSTENVHDEFAAIVPPDSVTEPLPAVAVIVPPPQEPIRLFGVATNRFAGKLSVNATPEIALAAGLLIVKVSVDFSPMKTFVGLNDLAIVGCASTPLANSNK